MTASVRRNSAGIPYLPFLGVTPDGTKGAVWRYQVTANYAGLLPSTDDDDSTPDAPTAVTSRPGIYLFADIAVAIDPDTIDDDVTPPVDDSGGGTTTAAADDRRNVAGLPFLPFFNVVLDSDKDANWRRRVTSNYVV